MSILKAEMLFKKKSYLEAMEICEGLIDAEPANAEAAFLSGQISLVTKNWNAAEYFFEYTLSIDQNFIKCHIALAECFLEQGKKQLAVERYKILFSIVPDVFLSRLKIGDILVSLFKIDEAIEHYLFAHQTRPAEPKCMIKLSNAYKIKGEFNQAQFWLDKLLSIEPDNSVANWNLSLLQLLRGDLLNGFINYDTRWKIGSYFLPHMESSEWDGSNPSDKTILVLAEQGWGDQIQFCRYIILLKDLGARVIFACPPRSLHLFSSLKIVCEIVERNTTLPKHDFYIPLISLPRIFKTELESIPNKVPYLEADGNRVDFWHKKLGNPEQLQIGISWREDVGTEPDSEFRNIPYSAFDPILSMFNFSFIALPLNLPQGATKHKNLNLLSDFSRDADGVFADTMAIIHNLDLVISPDSVYIHLSAAMGKPTWGLINKASEWRWLADGPGSLWYPTLKLFRQSKLGHWDDVLRNISQDLKKMKKNVS